METEQAPNIDLTAKGSRLVYDKARRTIVAVPVKREQPRLTDDDKGEISVTLDGKKLRGWSYAVDDERRQKMLQAREYVEGWCDGREA